MHSLLSALTAVAALMWVAAITGIWVRMPPRAMSVDLAAAVTATAVMAVWRAHDADRRATLRAVADATRPLAVRATGPLRRVQ